MSQEEISEMRDCLLDYGLEMDDQKIKNLEIIDFKPHFIVLEDERERKRIISNLIGSKAFRNFSTTPLDLKYDSVALLRIIDLETGNIVEHYHNTGPLYDYDVRAEKALQERRNKTYREAGRFFANVETKYGNFTLSFFRKKADFYLSLSKDHYDLEGDDEEVKTSFEKVFVWTYSRSNQQESFSTGFLNRHYQGLRYFVNYIAVPVENGNEEQVYLCNDIEDKRSGLIIPFSNIKKYDIDPHIFPGNFSTPFSDTIFLEDEAFNYTSSKAYFIDKDSYVSFIKVNDEVFVRVVDKPLEKESPIVFSSSFKSAKGSNIDGVLTEEDVKKISQIICNLALSDSFRQFVISNLNNYLSNRVRDNSIEKRKITILGKSFEGILEYLKGKDLNVLVENGLEKISSAFQISINEILGIRESNPRKEIEFKNGSQ